MFISCHALIQYRQAKEGLMILGIDGNSTDTFTYRKRYTNTGAAADR